MCLSMPWGDPHLKSANFLEHLNRRHKFEYHTYVVSTVTVVLTGRILTFDHFFKVRVLDN